MKEKAYAVESTNHRKTGRRASVYCEGHADGECNRRCVGIQLHHGEAVLVYRPVVRPDLVRQTVVRGRIMSDSFDQLFGPGSQPIRRDASFHATQDASGKQVFEATEGAAITRSPDG